MNSWEHDADVGSTVVTGVDKRRWEVGVKREEHESLQKSHRQR